MRKYSFTLLLILLALSTQAQQVRLGIKLSPVSFSSNRVRTDLAAPPSFDNTGAKMKFAFGPVADIAIEEDKYYFSTGFLYMTRHAGLTINSEEGVLEEDYNLQYIQIPATVKLFTNEVIPQGRLFFQLGTGFEVKVSQNTNSNEPVVENFKAFDIPVIIAAGLEYDLGDNSIFGGLNFQSGIINNFGKGINDVSSRSSVFSIEVGYFF